jgi:hypothetical protein
MCLFSYLETMSIIHHLEARLGKIAEGWSNRGEVGGLQVVRFDDEPVEHVNTFATLGLSNHVLQMNDGRDIRQELLVGAKAEYAGRTIADFLLTVGEELLRDHRAVLRGELVGGGRPIISGTGVTAAYASIPVAFGDSLQAYRESRPVTILVWLIPVFDSEALCA